MNAAHLLTLSLAFAAASAHARELVLVGTHAVEGSRDGVRYRGTLELTADGRFTCNRTFPNGAVERSAGRAWIDRTQLVLRAQGR